MTAVSHLWADIPTRRSAPLPAELSPAVLMRGPDPLRCRLRAGSPSAVAVMFEQWRSVHARTVRLGSEDTARVVEAWLRRSGQEVSLRREASWDAAAITALWWRCEEELDDVPALREFTAALGEVATACRVADTHAVLRVSATSYPTA